MMASYLLSQNTSKTTGVAQAYKEADHHMDSHALGETAVEVPTELWQHLNMWVHECVSSGGGLPDPGSATHWLWNLS